MYWVLLDSNLGSFEYQGNISYKGSISNYNGECAKAPIGNLLVVLVVIDKCAEAPISILQRQI